MSLLAITSDPGAWILFATLVGAALGFFAACVICARRIRRAEMDGWKAGVHFYHNQTEK